MQIDTKSLIKKLDRSALKALEGAINLAVIQKVTQITVSHWLYKLCEDEKSLISLLKFKSSLFSMS